MCDVCVNLKINTSNAIAMLYEATTNNDNLIEFGSKSTEKQLQNFLNESTMLNRFNVVISKICKECKFGDETNVTRVLNTKMKSSDIARIGTMKCFNQRNKEKMLFKWEICKSTKREFTFDMMNYFGNLFQNRDTKNIGIFKSLEAYQDTFESFVNESDIFDYSHVFTFLYLDEKYWGSVVIDLKNRTLNTFNFDNQVRKTLCFITDKALKNKHKETDMEDLISCGQEKEWNLCLTEQFIPELPILHKIIICCTMW